MTHAAVEPDIDVPQGVESETSTNTTPGPWSYRKVPWAKIGEITDEVHNAQDAAQLGGLDFDVVKWNVQGVNPDNPNEKINAPERSMLVRKDTKEWLGIMSDEYPILQYRDAFDFMNTISPTFVAAGALKGGRQGFMVVQPPETMELLSDVDRHELFAILRTSHDGSRAIEVTVQALRYRCMNQLTLNSFAAGVPYRWSIKHTSSMHKKLEDAKITLESMKNYAQRFEENAHRLMEVDLDDEDATSLLEMTLPNRPRRDEQVAAILNAWHTAETVGFDWTGYGLLSATSEYFDWGRKGGNAESRFVGALQGQTFNAINKLAGNILSRL